MTGLAARARRNRPRRRRLPAASGAMVAWREMAPRAVGARSASGCLAIRSPPVRSRRARRGPSRRPAPIAGSARRGRSREDCRWLGRDLPADPPALLGPTLRHARSPLPPPRSTAAARCRAPYGRRISTPSPAIVARIGERAREPADRPEPCVTTWARPLARRLAPAGSSGTFTSRTDRPGCRARSAARRPAPEHPPGAAVRCAATATGGAGDARETMPRGRAPGRSRPGRDVVRLVRAHHDLPAKAAAAFGTLDRMVKVGEHLLLPCSSV